MNEWMVLDLANVDGFRAMVHFTSLPPASCPRIKFLFEVGCAVRTSLFTPHSSALVSTFPHSSPCSSAKCFWQAMSHKDPLEIPEIVDVVVSFLQPQDLASCIRVAKGWRDTFLPRLWKVPVLSCKAWYWDMTPTQSFFGPHPDVVFHHRQLIQDLTLVKGVAPFVKHQYPNVRKLTIDFKEVHMSRRESVSLELEETFPSLVQFRMIHMAPVPWKALAAYPQIKTLQLDDIRIEDASIPAFWKMFENLEVLEMSYTLLPDLYKGLQTDVKFHRMRKLLLNVIERDDSLIELINRCPNLEDLEWTRIRNAGETVNQSLQNVCWPHLKKLAIVHRFQDDQVASLLQRVGNGHERVMELRLNQCHVGPEASVALASHFNTLVRVDLADCTIVLSTTTRDLMCHCPRLEVLDTRSVMAKDVVAGGPWVCQRLRKLTACFWFEESEKGLQQEIFERLSTLIRLEELTMRIPKNDDTNGVSAGLRHGTVGTLQFVSNISKFYHAELGIDEFEWITEHWRKLRLLKGSLNSDYQVKYQLKRYPYQLQ